MKPLRLFAVLFGLLAFSNFLKPFGFSGETGFVFLGRRLSGTPNLIAGWSFALFLACYSLALWRERAAALPLGIAYAAYVTANLFLFTLRMPEAPAGVAHILGLVVYAVIALGCSWGAVFAMIRYKFDALDRTPGRILLRSFALLFALMALSNVLKPFEYMSGVGFVLFGQRLAGTANLLGSLVFATLLAVYAASIWLEKRLALQLGIAYAIYVAANLVLWNIRKPEGAGASLVFALPYIVSAIGVSSGAAVLLWRQRERLR